MRYFDRHALLAGVAIVACMASPALAQASSISIPGQPLVNALEQLAHHGQTQILSTPALVAGKRSHAVQGGQSIESALREMLIGTGLSYRVSGAGFIIIAAQAAPASAAPARATAATSTSTLAAAPEGGQPEVTVADIVVTGSRVVRSGYDAPTPTTIMGAAAMEQRGSVTIADALNDVPAFTPTTSTGTAGARPFAPGANYANLRSLGPTRTLVLVDGHRFAPTVPSFSTVGANQVDLNLIPPIMLERAEVVTGGASAQWGSDAVAGVVNLILNNKFKGFKADLEKGVSQQGDNAETRIAAMLGKGFAAGRGHVVIAGEYYHNSGVGDIYTRPWGANDAQIVSNPSGLPKTIITDGARLSTMTTGGLITSGPLKGTMFGPGGTTSQFNYGTSAGSLLMIGGGVPGESLAAGLMLVPRLERYSTFGHMDFEVNDGLSLFAEGSYGVNKSQSFGIQPRDTGTITIQTSNPFLPASVLARATTAGITSFSLGRISDDIGHIDARVKNENLRMAIGAKGKFGDGWSWDTYYQLGVNDYRQDLLGQRINANFTLAVDAVRNAAGNIVCRSTLTNPTNGCVPINLFGQGSPSQSAIAYVTGNSLTTTHYRQQVAAANLRGEPFSTWAGPVSIALGVENRRERQNTTADAISMADGFNQQNPKALAGGFHVTEGYLETVVPLATGASWAKHLDLNGAVRYANYSTVGGVVTWKGGLSWTVNKWLLLRGTRSRDIRAPNIFELYAAPSPSQANVIDPVTNTQVAIRQFLIGNPNLRQETANTLSFGVGLKPVRGLELSVDYFKIDIRDAILSLQGASTINACQTTGDPFFCNNIIRNSAGTITRINAPYVNLGSLGTEGIDVEASYRFPLFKGQLSLRGIGTYTLHATSNNGFGTVDRAGEVGTNNNGVNPTPTFRGSFTTSYQAGPFSGSVQLNYIAKGKFDATFVDGVDIAKNEIPDRLYTNLNLSYTVDSGRFQLYGAVSNLFNVSPPNVPSTTFFLPTNPAFYDTIGRNFRMGVRLKL